MSKSLGNIFTVQDIINKGFDPLALRYLYLQTHYRQEMNFTWDALKAAESALNKLRKHFSSLSGEGEINEEFRIKFMDAVSDDLNTSKALALVWENLDLLNKPSLRVVDETLGLEIFNHKKSEIKMPEEVQKLLNEREALRKEKKFAEADKIREKIIEMGFKVEDKT